MRLVRQFLKFALVGLLCFLVEFGILTALEFLFGDKLYLLFSGIAFAASVLLNYILSMRFVFQGREDLSRTLQVVIYFILSILGLGINLLVMWVCKASFSPLPGWVSGLLAGSALASKALEYTTLVAKVIATVVVLFWNFFTRKLFLEKKGAPPSGAGWKKE